MPEGSPPSPVKTSILGGVLPTTIDTAAASVTLNAGVSVGAPITAPNKKPKPKVKGGSTGKRRPGCNKPQEPSAEDVLKGRGAEWRRIRANSLYELAKKNAEAGTLAEALEFLRSVWQDGLMIGKVINGQELKAVVREVQDQRLRMDAAERWLNRLYGQPVQQVEMEKGDDGAVRFLQVNIERFQVVAGARNAQLDALKAQLAQGGGAAGDAGASLPGRHLHLPADGDHDSQGAGAQPDVARRLAAEGQG